MYANRNSYLFLSKNILAQLCPSKNPVTKGRGEVVSEHVWELLYSSWVLKIPVDSSEGAVSFSSNAGQDDKGNEREYLVKESTIHSGEICVVAKIQ